MSLFLLDTDTISLYQHNHANVVREYTSAKSAGHTVGLTAITLEEQMAGWISAIRSAKTNARWVWASDALTKAVRLWATFSLYPMTDPAIGIFEQLRKQKLNVGRNDLLIAAIALAVGASVVTHNLREFSRIPNLAVVDWSVVTPPTTP